MRKAPEIVGTCSATLLTSDRRTPPPNFMQTDKWVIPGPRFVSISLRAFERNSFPRRRGAQRVPVAGVYLENVWLENRLGAPADYRSPL